MNKEWCDKKQAEYDKSILDKIEFIRKEVQNIDTIDDKQKAKFLAKLEDRDKLMTLYIHLEMFILDCYLDDLDDLDEKDNTDEAAIESRIKSLNQWKDTMMESARDISNYYLYYDLSDESVMCSESRYRRYQDSDLMHFEGSIIITDPCYIMKDQDDTDKPKWEDFHLYPSMKDYPDYDEDHKYSAAFRRDSEAYDKAYKVWSAANPDHWSLSEYGSRLDLLGIETYMTRDTIYGDWSCTTYDTNTNQPIGEFCADAGLVSVMLLDEVLKYNPDFNYHSERSWTTTLIEDFKGEVQFIVVRTEGVYDDTTDYHKKGDVWEEFEVQVHGHGINMKTGESINFMTTQTGL